MSLAPAGLTSVIGAFAAALLDDAIKYLRASASQFAIDHAARTLADAIMRLPAPILGTALVPVAETVVAGLVSVAGLDGDTAKRLHEALGVELAKRTRSALDIAIAEAERVSKL